jgi:acetoin utilization deacetylase AcuC-like enzyme
MATFLYFDADCIAHDPGPGHPEQPARLAAVRDALAAAEFADLKRQTPPPATITQITRVHPREHVEGLLQAVPSEGRVMIDADTFMSPGSGRAALLAAGAACAAVDAVIGGAATNAFCAVRPPGHHAETAQAMGFCLFNNVAIAAEHARQAHGLTRVAVVDFDVHHGNGTQHSFAHQEGLFFASSHQYPFYPGSGAESETGGGNIHNAPLPAGAGSTEFRHAWSYQLLPALRAFQPQLVIVSAGFDGHRDDPLAEFALDDDDYAWITDALLTVAAETADGRLVSSLEGGYDLAALGRSAAAHVRRLMAVT